MINPDWHADALCAQTGGDWWYADLTTHYQHKSRRYTPDPDDPNDHPCPTCIAISICDLCDVKTECLTTALNNDERHGIWAGLTPKQRTKVRRRNGIPPQLFHEPCGTTAAYRRHQRRNETPCTPCAEANRQAKRRQRENTA